MSFVKISYPKTGIALVTLNRPDRMNAMAFDVMQPLKEELEAISFNSEIRVVILTGEGSTFCAGADLQDPGYLSIFDGHTMPRIALRAMRVLDDVVTTIREMTQPVIAAINGPAVGGGFCLAMAADLRIAADSAFFRAAGINNGLTSAELGLSYLLPRAIGISRANDIMLTGRDVGAEEAERYGIVSRVVSNEALIDECTVMADNILRHSHLGVEQTKVMLNAGVDAGSLHSHMHHEGITQLFVRMTTKNFEEAIKARKQGRAPDFTDDV
jgi:enoyl-CoA hydratase